MAQQFPSTRQQGHLVWIAEVMAILNQNSIAIEEQRWPGNSAGLC